MMPFNKTQILFIWGVNHE